MGPLAVAGAYGLGSAVASRATRSIGPRRAALAALTFTLALAGVARRASRINDREQGVCVAVKPQRGDLHRVPGRCPLMPQLVARAAEEVKFSG